LKKIPINIDLFIVAKTEMLDKLSLGVYIGRSGKRNPYKL